MSQALASRIFEIGDRDVEIQARRSPRARRVILRVDPMSEAVTLVLPRGLSERDAWRFAESQRGWLERRIALVPPRVPFEPGAMVPFRGTDHRIIEQVDAGSRPADGIVKIVTSDDDPDTPPKIQVAGKPEHLARRLTDWMKRQARQELTRLSFEKADEIGRKIAKITVRDQRSRWGSCTHNGRLAYSWRLILAPPRVLDYVVAHEVAHLIELNHSRAFWKLTAQLAEEVDAPRAWLKRHGAALHRYG